MAAFRYSLCEKTFCRICFYSYFCTFKKTIKKKIVKIIVAIKGLVKDEYDVM